MNKINFEIVDVQTHFNVDLIFLWIAFQILPFLIFNWVIQSVFHIFVISVDEIFILIYDADDLSPAFVLVFGYGSNVHKLFYALDQL